MTSLLLSLIVPAMLVVVVLLQRDRDADPLAQAVSIGAFAAGNVAFAAAFGSCGRCQNGYLRSKSCYFLSDTW